MSGHYLAPLFEPSSVAVVGATEAIGRNLRPGMLVVLESTTYPGTTSEVVIPKLTEKGLEVGKDVFVAFSPERVDPGREDWTTKTTPKVVGGVTEECTTRAVELYESAGGAGIFLEDQVWPKKCGHMAGKKVVPREEWLGKLQAAMDHRWRLFVVARTDARAAVGLDETAAKRGQNYVTVFIDIDRGDKPVVFVTPGRGKETVARFKAFLIEHGGSPGRMTR